MNKFEASNEANIPYKTTQFLHKHPQRSSGWAYYKEWLAHQVTDVIPRNKLSRPAKRALDDFEFFRRRYFGHVSTPWQVQAAQQLIVLLENDQREYIVVNCPPGSGKSTLFTHDIPVWAAVRNRSNRCMIGTGSENTGTDYTRRVKTSLERTIPVEHDEREVARGVAVHPESTLAADFGRFKPTSRDYWRADKLVIAREGGVPAHTKEASFRAFGRLSGFLGGRYDLAIWDDLVNGRHGMGDENDEKWFKQQAETRIEPGGLLILQGQRLSPSDLYRFALDLRDLPELDHEDDTSLEIAWDQLPKKYHHIKFKAHYEEKCRGVATHKNHPKPYPHGCLLDPVRLPFRDLQRIRLNDSTEFELVYQQEDIDPQRVLVREEWLKGGVPDPVTGEILPGCYDAGRMLGEWPENIATTTYSVITVDPSPTKFWAIQWWLYSPENSHQYLIDMIRAPMEAPDILEWNDEQRRFTGVLEDWWARAKKSPWPINYVIVEANAAQRFILQYSFAKRWIRERGTSIVPHYTAGRHIKQPDLKHQQKGVYVLQPHYRHGRVRLPGHPSTRLKIQPLISEITRFPDSTTDDCLMAQWFMVHQADNLFPARRREGSYARPVPAWLRRKARRGVA